MEVQKSEAKQAPKSNPTEQVIVLEQPIPYRSPIHALDRIAVLSDEKAQFTPVTDRVVQ